MREHNIAVLHTREPGGTPLGDQVRELVLLRAGLNTVSRAEALLMCASRAQLVEEVIKPALKRNEVVVCDRFGDSTLAYQGSGRGLDLAHLEAVISFATSGLSPDMTILLDLPVETGLARKQAQPAAAWNRFEQEALAFHQRVRVGYRELAQREPRRWRCFDAQRPPRELSEEIWRTVAAELRRT
jgi:dTMP kinase